MTTEGKKELEIDKLDTIQLELDHLPLEELEALQSRIKAEMEGRRPTMASQDTRDEGTILASFLARTGDEDVHNAHLEIGETLRKDGTISKTEEIGEGEVRLEDLAFRGYAHVWDNRTGRRVTQPKWILWQTFQLKRPDGSRIFTDTDPKIPQNYGLDMVCKLHPDSPDYALLKERGFRPCFKKHTPTKIALDDHMRHSHKRAYATIKELGTERIREEDRELQRKTILSNQALIQAMAEKVTGAETAPLYVSPNPKPPRARRTRRGK